MAREELFSVVRGHGNGTDNCDVPITGKSGLLYLVSEHLLSRALCFNYPYFEHVCLCECCVFTNAIQMLPTSLVLLQPANYLLPRQTVET